MLSREGQLDSSMTRL
nr:unnamed protein product [Callosobruchus chinensis]